MKTKASFVIMIGLIILLAGCTEPDSYTNAKEGDFTITLELDTEQLQFNHTEINLSILLNNVMSENIKLSSKGVYTLYMNNTLNNHQIVISSILYDYIPKISVGETIDVSEMHFSKINSFMLLEDPNIYGTYDVYITYEESFVVKSNSCQFQVIS